MIRYLSDYVSHDVLDQMYKLYVWQQLDYGDIIYHKFDPEWTLEFTKKLDTVQYSAALAVNGAWRGPVSANSMKNLDGNTFITEDGTDVWYILQT